MGDLMRRRMELMATSKQLHTLSGPATYMGNPLTFTGDGSPLARCEIEFSAKQRGTGTPSPTNVRTITGVMAANVWIWSGEGQDEVIDQYFALGGTYYGGTVDLVSGVLTVTWGSFDLGALNYVAGTGGSGNLYRTTETRGVLRPADWMSGVLEAKCPIYTANTGDQTYLGTFDYTMGVDGTGQFYIYDSSRNGLTAAQFKSSIAGTYIVYRYITPQTYHIDPATIRSLNGTTNIWTTMGDNMTVAYWA